MFHLHCCIKLGSAIYVEGILKIFLDVALYYFPFWNSDELQQYTILLYCVVATKFMIHLTLWSAYDWDIFTSENAIAIWVEFCVISFDNLGWKTTSQAAPLELDTSTVLLLNIFSGEEWWPVAFYVWIADLEYLICYVVKLLILVIEFVFKQKSICYIVILLI